MNIEKYESKANTWKTIESKPNGRNKFGLVLLPYKKILIFGGKTSTNVKLKNSEELDLRTNIWKQGKVELYEAKSGFGYALNLNKLYIAGGNNGNSPVNSFDCHDIITGEKQKLPNMLSPREEFS